MLINATIWVDQKGTMLNEKDDPKRLYTVDFHLYSILEMTK
jgi:hypothetical protein